MCVWLSFRSLFLFWVSVIVLFTADFQVKSILAGIIFVFSVLSAAQMSKSRLGTLLFEPDLHEGPLICFHFFKFSVQKSKQLHVE